MHCGLFSNLNQMKTFLRFLAALIFSLLLINIWIVYTGRAQFPEQLGPRFDAQIDMALRDDINAVQPRILLLGDSMAEENVDINILSNALGQDVYRVSAPGSSSALWYLAIKNNIAAAERPPQFLIILFRDSMLTTPEYRVGGSFNGVLDKLADQNEETLLQRAFLNHMNPLERFARQYLPIYNAGSQFRESVEFAHRVFPPRFLLHCNRRCVDSAFLNIFSFRTIAPPAANDPIAQEEAILYSARSLNFAAQVDDSFLPEIIRICRERDIQLIFVRGKTISFVDLPKPRGLDDYILDLQNYLTTNGASFADLEPDARLGTADYIDRFHVQPEARGMYTQMLIETLIPLLP